MRYLSARGRAGGFSLVEVMVAVIVICVGLLGIAKMQALALSNTTTSRLRALAAIQAAGLAAAMHSNREYWAGATPPVTTTFNANATGQFVSTDTALQKSANTALSTGLNTPDTIQTCVGTANATAVCGAGTAAGVVGLAAFDLARWAASLNALLPNPQSTISCVFVAGGPAPPSCTIVISWSERAVAINQQQVQQEVLARAANSLPAIENPSYLLYVEP
jgi:type IV pilus assembly protein PilV